VIDTHRFSRPLENKRYTEFVFVERQQHLGAKLCNQKQKGLGQCLPIRERVRVRERD